MLPKDFENYELRLRKLREEREANFLHAQKVLEFAYGRELQSVFPRDALGIKKSISAFFIVDFAEKEIAGETDISPEEIFKKSVWKSLRSVPLSADKKEKLYQHVCKIDMITQAESLYFRENDSLRKDPFFALVEDFSYDGNISQEEFFLLQQSFENGKNFAGAVESLPSPLRRLFVRHMLFISDTNYAEKQKKFEGEFGEEIRRMEKLGFQTGQVIPFISQGYYKTPEKYRSKESSFQRMRRTFKMALLRLLRIKGGDVNIDAYLQRFENCRNFEDFFRLLYELFDILEENPQKEEIYQVLSDETSLKSLVFTAEKTQEKILAGESIIARISQLFSHHDAKMESGVLSRVLDETTDLIGEEFHFAHTLSAGILKSGEETQKQKPEEDPYENMSPEVAYEILSQKFQELQNQKQQAFLLGEYERIDAINEQLISLEIKLTKLIKILGLEDEE